MSNTSLKVIAVLHISHNIVVTVVGIYKSYFPCLFSVRRFHPYLFYVSFSVLNLFCTFLVMEIC